MIENSFEVEENYPVKWDIKSIFQSDEDWYCSLEYIKGILIKYDYFKDKLTTVEGILEFIEIEETLIPLLRKAYIYMYLQSLLNIYDISLVNKLQMVEDLYIIYDAKLNNIVSILTKLSKDQKKILFNEKELSNYKNVLISFSSNNKISKNVRLSLEHLVPVMSQPINIYYSLLREIKLEVDFTEYCNIINSQDLSLDKKTSIEKKYLRRYSNYENTFANILYTHGAASYGMACIEGFTSVLDYQLYLIGIDKVVYNFMEEYAKIGFKLCKKYFLLKKYFWGIKKIYNFHLKLSISDYQGKSISYNEIIENTRKALKILGNEYIDLYNKIVTSKFIDVFEEKNKSKQNMTIPSYGNNMIYILLNLRNISGDEVTFAHEIGHAIYSMFTEKEQSPLYFNIPLFLHEIPAIVNEFLICEYSKNNASTIDEAIYYTEQLIEMIINNFFMSFIYSMVEKNFYSEIENGNVITASILNKYMEKGIKEIYGGITENMHLLKWQWIEIHHYYSTYYLIQYSTSLIYALNIIEKLKVDKNNYVDRYIQFLKSGNSEEITELLKNLDIELDNINVYKMVNYYFQDLIDEYEELLSRKKCRR